MRISGKNVMDYVNLQKSLTFQFPYPPGLNIFYKFSFGCLDRVLINR